MIIAAASLISTVGQLAAMTAAIVSACAAALGFINRRHIREIHVLVNSNLTEIKDKLALVTAERDQLLPDPTEEPDAQG